MSFNKVIIVGNLGRDPDLRYTTQGQAVCAFSVATNERRKDRNGEPQDVVTWFRVTAWGKLGENVSKYLSKGRSVYVEGRLHVGEWTDKDGQARHTLEVNASDVHFIGGGAGANGEADGVPISHPGEAHESAASSAAGRAPQPAIGGAVETAVRRRPATAAAATTSTGTAKRGSAAAGDDDIPF